MRPTSARYVDMEQGDGLVEQPEAAETPPGPPAVPGVQATQAQHPTWTVDEAIDDIGFGPYQLVMLCVTHDARLASICGQAELADFDSSLSLARISAG